MSVRLREAGAVDYTGLLHIIDDPEIAPWLFADGPPQGMYYLSPPADAGVGPVFVAEVDGNVIGGGRIERAGFSYFVAKPVWRKGYGLHIAARMLAQFHQSRPAQRPILLIRRENRASARIAERLGFHFAGLKGNNPVMLMYTLSSMAQVLPGHGNSANTSQ